LLILHVRDRAEISVVSHGSGANIRHRSTATPFNRLTKFTVPNKSNGFETEQNMVAARPCHQASRREIRIAGRILGRNQRDYRAGIELRRHHHCIAGSHSRYHHRRAAGFSLSLLGIFPWNYILAIFAAVVICGLLVPSGSFMCRRPGCTWKMTSPTRGTHERVAAERVSRSRRRRFCEHMQFNFTSSRSRGYCAHRVWRPARRSARRAGPDL
jgi:hypothetical protein